MPRTAAKTPFPVSPALFTNPWIPAAPSSPISPRNWANISPRAASSPKKNPATAMAITSSGAIEKIV